MEETKQRNIDISTFQILCMLRSQHSKGWNSLDTL